ncbi:MAG: zf-TFIIB domain-containing protein [Actinomycetota bacterium]
MFRSSSRCAACRGVWLDR